MQHYRTHCSTGEWPLQLAKIVSVVLEFCLIQALEIQLGSTENESTGLGLELANPHLAIASRSDGQALQKAGGALL